MHADKNEKMQLKERLEKLKLQINQLEAEKRHLQDELTQTESKATKLEILRIGLEGDLQRLQMMLQEKDNHIQVIILKHYVIYKYLYFVFRNLKKNVRVILKLLLHSRKDVFH